MSVTATLTPSPSPTPEATTIVSPSPAVPVAAGTVVAQPDPPITLQGQISHVDPLIWSALAGILVVPFVHQGIKKVVKFLSEPEHRVTNYLVATLLSLLVGLLTDLQNSGLLTKLHNPMVATLLASALTFLLGQNVYGFFIKTNQEAKAGLTPDAGSLPTVLNP